MADLTQLYKHGQSVWLDYINRGLIVNGGLQQLVDMGLRGVTSNPTIFHKSITGGRDYDEAIKDLLQADHQLDEHTLYQWLTIQDIQMAADVLHPVYISSEGGDGFVSLEISPHLAYDTEGTIERVRHLWREVDRDNLMIKVPATREGLPAIERLTAEGYNINVTLLFSVSRYEEVANAFVRGLGENTDPAGVASVASFFVSRVDTKLDPVLKQIGSSESRALQGRIAIANAKMAYRCFTDTFGSSSFDKQRKRGAKVQRLLWGSTSTKNPAYRDVMYVEELIGAHTVNTMPPDTLDAFLAHGEVRSSVDENVDEVTRLLGGLSDMGIDYEQVMRELEEEGVRKFTDSYDQLLEDLKEKCLSVSKQYAMH